MSVPAEPSPPVPPSPVPSVPAEGSTVSAARVRQAVLVGVLVAVAGVPLGLCWALLAPEVPVQVTSEGPAYVGGAPSEPFAADGWFAALSAPFGLLAAVAVWWAARMLRGVPGLAAVTVGSLAAAALAWQVGRRLGLAGYREELAAADLGEVLTRPADLGTAQLSWLPPWVGGVLLVPALAAAVAYTLLAAVSSRTELAPAAEQPAVPGDPRGS